MKSRLSIEIKGLLEPKKLGASRYNPESSNNLTTASTSTKPPKRSDSTSTLRRTDTEISTIEDRYRALEQNYRELLEETRGKGQLFRKQREELDRLRHAHDRDQKEILQLRTLLEITRNTHPVSTLQHSHARPPSPKMDKHCTSVPRQRKSPAGRGQQQCGVAGGAGGSGLRKNSRVRVEGQGFGKYKFVPSLPLQ